MLLTLALLLSMSASASTWSEGKAMVKKGHFYDAAKFWIEALDQDQYDQGALKGLDRYAEAAYEQRLDMAQEHEAEKRFEQSLQTYDDLLVLNALFREIEAIEYTDHQQVLELERKDTYDGWVTWLLKEGAAGLARNDWEKAEKNYQHALELNPDLPEARKQLSKAQYELGQVHMGKFHYRTAVEYFDAAMANGYGREAREWSFATHKELGRYFMNEGACRQAARELRKAGDFSDDMEMVELLTRAEDCARVELIVEPFEAVAGGNMAGSAPAAMLVDRLEAALRDQGSEFLVLLDPQSQTAADALAGGLAGARPGALYQLRGRITQLAVERPEASTTSRSVEGKYQVVCPLPEGVYYRAEEWCDASTTIFYEERSARLHAMAEGSIKVIEPRSSEQLLTSPVSAKIEKDASQNVGFQRTKDGEKVPAQVGDKASSDVYAIPAEVLAKLEQPPPLPTDSVIASEVTTELARNMAKAILEVVDQPIPLDDPKVIDNFEKPVLDAGQIDLSGGKGGGSAVPKAEPKPEPVVPPTGAVIPK